MARDVDARRAAPTALSPASLLEAREFSFELLHLRFELGDARAQLLGLSSDYPELQRLRLSKPDRGLGRLEHHARRYLDL